MTENDVRKGMKKENAVPKTNAKCFRDFVKETNEVYAK